MINTDIDGFDRKEYNSVILAALFHDIGKFLQRQNDQTYKISHRTTGASFIREIAAKMNLPAASCGVSKTARNEASFGEFTPRDY